MQSEIYQTDGADMTARDSFILNLKKIRNSAVLIKKAGYGRPEPVFVTEEFAALMECSTAEAEKLISGGGFFSTTHQEDRIFELKMLRRRVSDDGGKELTIRKITSKGTVKLCRVSYAFIDDYNEHYVYCTYFDITALKEYEERTRSAYMDLGDSFYQADDSTFGMFRVNLSRDSIEDMQGTELYGTDSMVYPYSEVMRMRAENYPIEEERRRFLTMFSRENLLSYFRAGKAQLSQTIYSRRRDGRSCYVRLSAGMTSHPLTGDIIAFITEKESNKEKVNETLLEKILSRQFDMVAYLSNDRYGVIIGDASNIKRGSIFPLSREGNYRRYLDAQVFPVLSGSDEKKKKMSNALYLETISKRLSQNELYVVNIACDINGETYYKRFDFYNIDREAKFYIVLKSDTTDIQKEQRKRNEQLKNALDEAKQASVAKTAFLSRMSHEIRTPMNAIIGLDNLALKEPELTPVMRDYLVKIGAGAKYLLTLINDILDMSRIESGRMTLNSREFSMTELMEQVNIVAGSQCRDKGLNYECVIDGIENERYIGDDTKLKQVLINILGNAVKFTDPGGTVTLKAVRTARFDGQSTLRFIIRDTGIGMDKEYLPKIFEAFSQEDSTNTSVYGGSGLGLAITKNIVEMMNGEITVESEKGAGSEFRVDVTLKDGTGVRPEDVNEDEAPAAQASVEGAHILLAEDMLINAEIMKQLLKMKGMEVSHAENGRLAVDMFAESGINYYDAVLMDVRMPVMDGLQATEAIRALDRPDSKTVPIIAMTANAFDEDVQRSLQAGMNAHLAKPVEPDLLYSTISKFMTKRGI